MRRTAFFFWAMLLGGAIGACSSVRSRCSPVLGEGRGLAVSNSLMFTEKHEPVMRDGQIEADYSLVVQNLGPATFSFSLSAATAAVEKEAATASCRVRMGKEGEATFVLRPDSRGRIDCTMRLSPEATRLVARGDRELVLSLPVHTGPFSATLKFAYALRVEDAR